MEKMQKNHSFLWTLSIIGFVTLVANGVDAQDICYNSVGDQISRLSARLRLAWKEMLVSAPEIFNSTNSAGLNFNGFRNFLKDIVNEPNQSSLLYKITHRLRNTGQKTSTTPAPNDGEDELEVEGESSSADINL